MSDKKRTYITLFSSAGVGCYGFKLNGFECIATNEFVRCQAKRNRKPIINVNMSQGYIRWRHHDRRDS